ncbi:hypothetical protein PCA76_30910 [Micromonospora sp. LH3U1]|nr:hypothetical protein [Micromonospora sp. LH3U1]WCN81238.1 hypothetical protein PCA76_30910 [Micromonospora sp. LH3U1]
MLGATPPGRVVRAGHPGATGGCVTLHLDPATGHRGVVHRRLDGRHARPARSGGLASGDGTGEGGTAGVETAADRGNALLGPLRLVERLVTALRGGHDLGAQLPTELLDLIQQLVGPRRGALAVGTKRDGEADQHHREDGEHRGETQRAVTVGNQQNERRHRRECNARPEEHGQQR